MNLDLARQLYFRELDGKTQQDTRLGIYVGLLSVIGGAVLFVMRSAWPMQSVWSRVSLGLSSLSAVLYFLAVVLVFRAVVAFSYETLPSPDHLLAYWEQLLHYYAQSPSVGGNASADFDDFLLRHLSEAATRNARSNLARSARFHLAAQFLFWVVVLAAAAALFLAAHQMLPMICRKGP